MLTDPERERYNLLREREMDGSLAAEEMAELDRLMQRICDAEATYLTPANERKASEAAALSAAAERLESENRQLREYLREREAFLTRARALVTQLRDENHQIRERFRDTLALAGESPGRQKS